MERADRGDRRREHHRHERRHDRDDTEQARGRERDQADLAARRPDGAQPRVIRSPSIAVALDHLRGRHRGRAEREHSERDEHDDEWSQRIVGRVLLLGAGGLERVPERADRGGEVVARVEPGREVDVAGGVDDQVAVRLVERAREHERTEDQRLVGDRLVREDADPDDRDVGLGRLRRHRVEEPEVQAITHVRGRRARRCCG